MAKPIKIKETPTLDGRDVIVFLNKIKASNIKQISTAEQSRILKNYQKLNKLPLQILLFFYIYQLKDYLI